MKLLAILLALCLLTGCIAGEPASENLPVQDSQSSQSVPLTFCAYREIAFASRFETVTAVTLSDTGISVNGAGETEEVFTSQDIIYYEDKKIYESGNPYGEGQAWETHTAAEAAAHTVVNITAPGAYRISGKLSKGQIRIDLGEDAYENPDAVVELILSNADITCTVAPAVIFMNVYECDGKWSVETAKANIDTDKAGANLILEGTNTVKGSHVAKIFKDKEGEKKLWKQDGAIYSYMSMNVFGPGKLDLTADNEGLDTELHLTINGGDIAIRADNDGINTNEDGVSVTTINGGNLHIIAGLGAEGDGIDSNGYLVINGGTVVSAANPGADAGLDSDLGSFIHGGNVIALGSAMDWAESDSEQVTMNLQFAKTQSADAAVVVTRQDGTVIFAYDPGNDEVLADNSRVYSGAILSGPNFHTGETYHVYVDGELEGTEYGGIYNPNTVVSYGGGTQMAFTGTDVMGRPGGMGGMEPPEGFAGEMPEGMEPPEGMEFPEGTPKGQRPEMPEGMQPGKNPEGMELPEGFEPGQMPGGMGKPEGGFGGREAPGDFSFEDGEPNTLFYMQDQVNFFSGLTSI